MLVSEVMLLLFVAEWIRSQYRVQEKRLDEDIRNVFTRVEERITNDTLDRTVALVLQQNPPDKGQGKMEINYVIDSSSTSVKIHDSASGPFIMKHAPAFTMPTGIRDDTLLGQRVKRMEIKRFSDIPHLPDDIKKILRVTIRQAASSTHFFGTGFMLAIDSTQLRKGFVADLKKKQLPADVYWDTLAVQKTAPLFSYRQSNESDLSVIRVKGYQLYLFKMLLPQAGFSFVLLLLTGLAFWMAYRNMKQQTAFSEQKDSFISNISHELKTPVATTKVALEALSTYNALDDPARSRKYLQMATWEIARLEALINRVMNTIMAEDGRISLDKETIHLPALLQEITGMLQPLLAQKDKKITWQQPDEPVLIEADKMHMQGTVYNLLDNAVKYGGDTIGISLEAPEGKAVLKISDNGPGIPAAYHRKIFEKFFRVPSGNRHDVKGHGLGLSYAWYVVQAHGGTIAVESSGNEGATFVITLPLSKHTHEA